ncbi:GNAT family N-acetyltransferase [uncultured Roseivirga sp.]|uniref:GNAT family N-acetyltransferase n=1 Tax=uncultured Roseivirga sp. TaxID=543088 RepID=UPI000D78F3DB|nr:GNAT family N-acetyltransferase [uncultured Roseivirga sp.]PWL31628.1 MAG: GNAT family N-acetyltransferase [Roseivirga sp. XM-24bin3]
MSIKIRPSTEADLSSIYALIKEFSIFQKTPEKVKITLEQMIEDQNDFKCLVAVDKDKVIGFSSYYFAYHSWTGKVIYLDDLYVQSAYRGQNIGNQLFDAVMEIGKSNRCIKMKWLVSDWNTKAQEFYKSRGATIESTEWICDLGFK